ncbi:putative mannosyl-oligosaccharide alpha-1,2-mannosidase 1B [Labeo rohita]|uniref:Mannosyl-oligosaccharide alpha-1,2-mannosidase 1B n=1 Tax=Labeo rohita TaxID=84645 RepID=A0ABQ8LPC5_LABRO|nr:putative mannosyl-oligosaccharide alpha-1,2-mannosidase 1B [Labeo rohita]
MATPIPGGPAHLESTRRSSVGRDALAHSWTRGHLKYAFPSEPPCTNLCEIGRMRSSFCWCILLTHPEPGLMTLMFLVTALPSLAQSGTIWHLHPDLWNLHVWLLDGMR